MFQLYGEQRYADALALLAVEEATLPTYRSDLAHTAACLQALSGDPQAALDTLRGAAADGAWWHPRLLVDEDLAGIRGLPGFAGLVHTAATRAAEAQRRIRALPPVVRRPADSPRLVLVALHGAGQDAAAAARDCAAAVDVGGLLVAVDSSQHSTPTYRTWPDQSAAAGDVAAALSAVRDEAAGLPVVAAGFSAGARAAVLWALSGDPVPVAGFLAVAPAIRPEQVADAPAHPPGVVVIGDGDDLLPDARSAVDSLSGVRLEVVPHLGHDYPPDFPARLVAALDELVPRRP